MTLLSHCDLKMAMKKSPHWKSSMRTIKLCDMHDGGVGEESVIPTQVTGLTRNKKLADLLSAD